MTHSRRTPRSPALWKQLSEGKSRGLIAATTTAKALDDSILAYSYSGQLTGDAIPTETVSGSDSKTLRELKDESDTKLPNFLPFIQLNLGLKARLTKNIHLLVDAGVFDGFMISGGLAVRL